jgi:hypothetical protein
MARRRVSFKVAPGIRISASSRGLRTSLGNRTARVAFGAGGTYTSAKIAGVRLSQQHSTGSQSRAGGRSPRGNPPASFAQLQREEKAHQLQNHIAALAALEKGLVTLHREHFPAALPPLVPSPIPVDREGLAKHWQIAAVKDINVFKRKARKAAMIEAATAAESEANRVDASNQLAHRRYQAAADTEWRELLAHKPSTVIDVLERAFSDNASDATCVDAGIDDGRRYGTVVILFGPASAIPERTPATTPTGKPTTRKRTKSDRNSLYITALGSTVLATVKEAFSVAPQLDDVRIVVLRHDTAALKPTERLAHIYNAEFERVSTESLPWHELDPARQLVTATNANLERKGIAGDVVALHSADAEINSMIAVFAEALSNRTPAAGHVDTAEISGPGRSQAQSMTGPVDDRPGR